MIRVPELGGSWAVSFSRMEVDVSLYCIMTEVLASCDSETLYRCRVLCPRSWFTCITIERLRED